MATPLDYEIRVEGRVPDDWAAWLGDARAEALGDGTTALHVSAVDRAALHGVLNQLFSLGLTLVAVRREVDGPATD